MDFVNGLSPVISIEQKTVMKNPRSTVGTMTDLYDYLRMLFATIGRPRCPITEEPVKIWTAYQMADHIIDLGPEGGHNGGQIFASGPPEAIAKVKRSYTGQFLKAVL